MYKDSLYFEKDKVMIQEQLSVRCWKTKPALPAFQRQQPWLCSLMRVALFPADLFGFLFFHHFTQKHNIGNTRVEGKKLSWPPSLINRYIKWQHYWTLKPCYYGIRKRSRIKSTNSCNSLHKTKVLRHRTRVYEISVLFQSLFVILDLSFSITRWNSRDNKLTLSLLPLKNHLAMPVLRRISYL